MQGDIGQLAAVIGHELRNPLAAALTGAALLGEMIDAGDPRRAVLDGVQRDLARLSGLLSSYLDFARGRTGNRRPLELAVLCRRFAAVPGVSVQCERGLRVLGDEHLLGRAIENLIDNARQAGATRVVVAARACDARIELTVSDDGPGIPAALAQRVFEPGFSMRGGTGLGLCIVAATVNGHGGTVRCEPQSRGTRFSIELPAVPAECGATA
jgi:signal transduction histidine kinase